jgi:sulfate permease, SulP family
MEIFKNKFKEKFKEKFKDALGAFADGGVLFPLIVLLASQGSFSAPMLFASAGLAYLVSGWFFKIPLSVQPLKAIAIAAVAIGASGPEIRVSGLCLGIFCLLMTLTDVNRIAKKVPASVVHCVQLGLGVVLVYQGMMAVWSGSFLINGLRIGLAIALVATISFFASRPLLGILAAVGLIAGLIFPSILPHLPSIVNGSATPSETLRVMTILSLVLPQLALTLTNSVIAAADVAHRYYEERAVRVTERNLLLSIGAGNVISAMIGGLPYCHGSGGMTAHYRGGARTSFSNIVIGVFMIGVAVFAYASGKPMAIGYPDFLLASLLMAVGIFHLGLAQATWATLPGKFQLLASGLAALLTRNMLVVLGVAVGCEFLLAHRRHGEHATGMVAR